MASVYVDAFKVDAICEVANAHLTQSGSKELSAQDVPAGLPTSGDKFDEHTAWIVC